MPDWFWCLASGVWRLHYPGMADLQLRARSASEIVDAAFALYRRQPLQYILLTAFAYAPWLVIRLILLGANSSNAAALASLSTTLIIGIGNLLTYSVISAALVRIVSQAYLGEEPDVGAAVRDGLPRVPAIIGAAIVKSVAIFVGALLFLVGALYFVARFFCLNQVIILERRGAMEALSRSGELSRGRKGHILGTLLLVLIIYLLLGLGIALLGGLTSSEVVREVLTTSYVIVAYPLFAITETLLYYDARIRAEGFDIEVLAGALGAAPPNEQVVP